VSQEVYEMITRLDRERIETHLVVQCAPMISGIKISNLFNVEKRLAFQLKQVLERSGISYYLLLESEDKVTFLVYREDELKAYLMQDRVCQSMKNFGYESLDLTEVLKRFQKRYTECMELKAEFPHEMGLLLGYPVEDVRGFIEHQGRDYLCTGYWKVYENLEQKQQLFQRFEYAKENLVLLLSYGVGMADIMDIFGGTGQKTLYQECAG